METPRCAVCALRPARRCPGIAALRPQQIRHRSSPPHWASLGAAYSERKDSLMSHSSTEFHKIWIEQCATTEDIREQSGVDRGATAISPLSMPAPISRRCARTRASKSSFNTTAGNALGETAPSLAPSVAGVSQSVKCRSRHPHPAAGQGGVREVAVTARLATYYSYAFLRC